MSSTIFWEAWECSKKRIEGQLWKNPAEDKEVTQTFNLYMKSRYKIVAHSQSYFFYFLLPIERTTLFIQNMVIYHWKIPHILSLKVSGRFTYVFIFSSTDTWGFCASDKLLRSLSQKKMIVIIFLMLPLIVVRTVMLKEKLQWKQRSQVSKVLALCL